MPIIFSSNIWQFSIFSITCLYFVQCKSYYLSSKLHGKITNLSSIHFPHILDYFAPSKLLAIVQFQFGRLKVTPAIKKKQKTLGGVKKIIKIHCIKMNSNSETNTLQLLWHLHFTSQEDRLLPPLLQKFFSYAFKNNNI